MAASDKPVFSINVPVRWGDMDAYGHVNNTVYFRLFEEARIQWLGSLHIINEREGPIIVTTGANFQKELGYPVDLRVDLHTGKAGNSSLMTYYRLIDNDDGSVYAEGEAKLVWFDKQARSSAPLPPTLRELAAE